MNNNTTATATTTQYAPTGIRKIKFTYAPEELESNVREALLEIVELAKARNYQVSGSLDSLLKNLEISELSLSGRKALARKTYMFQKSKTRRQMAALVNFVTKRAWGKATDIKVVIKPSPAEEEIIELRKKRKDAMKALEEMTTSLKEKKLAFKSSGGIYETQF